MARAPLINEDKASDTLSLINAPFVKNLVNVVIARIYLRYIQPPSELLEHRENRLADAPFDMDFMVSILIEIFSRKEMIRGLLDGRTIADVTGWDV